ncbi:MAG: DUF2333 family protein [Deltaproteobacteria bacterium]|nr:DUF2333 family protein [Deltaproteobacteria bacterium]
MTDHKSDTAVKKSKRKLKYIVALVILVLLIFFIVVMAMNSIKPDPLSLSNVPGDKKGSYFIKANQVLVEQMLRNWLPNDIFWPTALLDNMPSFQIGQLEVIRYNVRVLRDNLSRMRTTDKLDPLAEAAYTSLSNDPFKWWFPSAENKLKQGLKSLETYYDNLLQNKSPFYPRADNLVELLDQYTSLMGGTNSRLINAPRDVLITVSPEDAIGDTGLTSAGKKDMWIPWHKIDDNFYYAQGVAYALHLSFKAIMEDFYPVLEDKNSVRLVDQIIDNLGRCNFEPLIVFNGDPDSIFANHSLNLSGVFNDARQKINSLTVALKQG